MTRAHLTHVARPTAHYDASVSFYRDFVGLEVVHEREDDGVHVAWLGEEPRGNSFVLVIIGFPRDAPIPPHFADHLGYDVSSREEVDAIAAKAKAQGILHHPAADGGAIVGYYCMVEDPDGNLVEFSFGQPIELAE